MKKEDFTDSIYSRHTMEISVSCLPADCGFENAQVDVEVHVNNKFFVDRFLDIYFVNFCLFLRRMKAQNLYACFARSLDTLDKNFSLPADHVYDKKKSWENMIEKSIYRAIGPTTDEMKAVDKNNAIIQADIYTNWKECNGDRE